MPTMDDFPNIRVLFVDDEPFVRRVTVDMLKGLGINEVSAAGNGVEAISLMGEHEIDLLITDIQMPEMNGIELIRQYADSWRCSAQVPTGRFEQAGHRSGYD